MSENCFQNIQVFFFQQQKQSNYEKDQFIKDQQASTLPTSKNNKLLKNRISAQNSRLRKKKYIQQLEKNQKELIKQLQQTQKEIEKAKEQLNSILTKSKENDCFNCDEKPTYERLNYLIKQQQHLDEDQANMLIQMLINRIGVTSKQRLRMLQYYSKRLINFSATAICRYILQSSTQDKGLLSNSDQSMYEWDKELYQKLQLSQDQKLQLNSIKPLFTIQKNIWIQKINQFNEVRSQIHKTSANIERQVKQLKQSFNTRQTAEVILSIQSRKYNKQFSFQRNQAQNPRKKIKKQ